MSNIDMSLDDIIDKSSRRGGRTAAPRANAGRAPGGARQTTGRAPGGRAVRNTRSNTRAEPYARAPGGKRASKESDHMASADVPMRRALQPWTSSHAVGSSRPVSVWVRRCSSWAHLASRHVICAQLN